MATRVPRQPGNTAAKRKNRSPRCESALELSQELKKWALAMLAPQTPFGADLERAVRSFYLDAEEDRFAISAAGDFACEVRTLLEEARRRVDAEPGSVDVMTSLTSMLAHELTRFASEPRRAWLSDEQDRCWAEWRLAKNQSATWRVIAVTTRLLKKPIPANPAVHPGGGGWIWVTPKRQDYAAVHVLVRTDLPEDWIPAKGITVQRAIEVLKDRYRQAFKYRREPRSTKERVETRDPV